MAPEVFVQIVENQQANLISGPGEPVAIGATDEGEQIAVLQGRQQGEQNSAFVVVTAPNTDLEDNTFTTEAIWTGSRQVRQPSYGSGVRERTIITLSDGRTLGLPETGKRLQAEDGEVRLGMLAVHPATELFNYRGGKPAANVV